MFKMTLPQQFSVRPLALTLAGLACLVAGSARAETSPYYLGVSQRFTHNSNVFLNTDALAKSDTISSTGVRLGLDQPISVAGFLENARDTAVQTLIATGAMQAGGAAGGVMLGNKERDGYRRAADAADAAREAALKKWGFAFNGEPAKQGAAAAPRPPAAPRADPAVPPSSATIAPIISPPAPAPDKPTPDAAPLNADDLLGTPVDDGAHIAATSPTNDLPEPTDAQKKAGNYKVGRIKLGGLDISIENPQGSVRRGVDEDGKAWENRLQHHYGYIRGTEGNDGDHVDAFIKPGTPDD